MPLITSLNLKQDKNTDRNQPAFYLLPLAYAENVNDICFSGERLWLLTRKGLSMLNPSNLEITNFTNDSIPFRNGLFMETDSLGNVWLASKKPGGLWKFDGITWTRIGYRNGLHSNRIKNFVIGKNHHILTTGTGEELTAEA